MSDTKGQLYLIRGLPGSGKSTLALQLSSALSAVHYEADMWMRDESGAYAFDAKKLPEVHGMCCRRAASELAAGTSVFVANTFTTMWEMRPYFRMTSDLGAPVPIVIELHGAYGSTHDVPEWVMTTMAARWEPYVFEKVIN